MSQRKLPFSGPPSRLPGEGPVELEPVAGDIQLAGLRHPGSKRPSRTVEGVFRPHEPVPVSGVYDIVDKGGNYLRSQVTCHQGSQFPPTKSHFALGADGRGTEEDESHFGYRLAYEAVHLQRAARLDDTIRLPGERVPVSGVYDVVDMHGEYLLHQRACVEGEVFPVSDVHDPDAYGYRLQYEAEHLSHS
jgi:hypothetical protein